MTEVIYKSECRQYLCRPIDDLEVVFRRRVPVQNYPIWLRKALAIERKGGSR